jgi:hypothetical protein
VRLTRFGKSGVDGLVRGDVDLAEDATDLGGDLFAAGRVAVEDGDLDAFGGKRAGGRLAEPRGGSGNDGGDG